MNLVIKSVSCVFATVFFGILLKQPKESLPYTAVISLCGYLVYILLGEGMIAFFISGLLIGILCETAARLLKRTTTLFMISSIIPLVPGLGLYRSVLFMVHHDYLSALKTAVNAIGGIGAIALAITLSTMLFTNIHLGPGRKDRKESSHAFTDFKR